jgi:hypothetical protein
VVLVVEVPVFGGVVADVDVVEVEVVVVVVLLDVVGEVVDDVDGVLVEEDVVAGVDVVVAVC